MAYNGVGSNLDGHFFSFCDICLGYGTFRLKLFRIEILPIEKNLQKTNCKLQPRLDYPKASEKRFFFAVLLLII